MKLSALFAILGTLTLLLYIWIVTNQSKMRDRILDESEAFRRAFQKSFRRGVVLFLILVIGSTLAAEILGQM